MEDDYSSGFGSDVGNLGTGSYGASGYDTYRRAQDYSDYGQSRRGNTGMSGYRRSYRPQQDDYGSYSSDYGYQGNRSHSGFNRPDYGRDYWNSDQRQYGNYGGSYNQDRYRNEDRDWWDRTRDEVSSWFGDEDAERRRRMDRQEDYRGRGPKGYKRSDERIREDINDRLSDDPFIDASDLEVSVNNCEVTLSGHVYDRSAKRRAEDLVESISGVRNVENRIRVNREEEADYKYPTATTTGGATNTNSRVENGKTRTSSSSAI
jgi:osmotically-inducible protein OsmY